MRSLLVLAAVLAVAYSGKLELGLRHNRADLLPKFVRVFEDTINETLECVRYNLINGLPEYNFPSVEPLNIAELNVDVDNLNISAASGYVRVRDLVLAGLTSYQVPEIEGKISAVPMGYQLDITVIFKNFDLDTLYDLNMIFSEMNLFGDGTLKWKIEDLSLKISAFASLADSISIQNLSVLIHIGSSHAHFTGWYNDEEHSNLFNELINEYIFPSWINQQPEAVDEALSPLIQDLINGMLSQTPTRLTIPDGLIDALITCPVEETA